MKRSVLASIWTRAPRLLASAALLTLPALAFAQQAPDLGRLLFEVGEPEASAATDRPPAPAESDEALPVPGDAEALVLSSIGEYERAAAEIELAHGPFAQDLSEQLQALAGLYETAGNHEAAIATYEKAVHILRVNNGLFTLEQTPLVRGIIRNYQALNDHREADNRQEYLYYLKQKNYDDGHPEMIQAMFEWADWNVQAYYRELDEQSASRFTVTQSAGAFGNDYIPVLGPNNSIYYVPRQPGFNSGFSLNNSYLNSGGMSVQYMLDPRLRRARDLYEEIAERIEEASPEDGGPLPETGHRLANISFIVKQEMDYLSSRLSSSSLAYGRNFRVERSPEVSRGYVKGRDSLEELLAQTREDPESTPLDIALALIDLADWQLAFDRTQAAYESYREAHHQMLDAGMSEEEIDAVFAPLPAVEIPVYATHRHSRPTLGIPADAEVEYRGWIDLRLDVDRYGNPRRPRVEGMSPDTHPDVREALLDHLRMAKLRPRLRGGEAVEQENIVLRYHYSY